MLENRCQRDATQHSYADAQTKERSRDQQRDARVWGANNIYIYRSSRNEKFLLNSVSTSIFQFHFFFSFLKRSGFLLLLLLVFSLTRFIPLSHVHMEYGGMTWPNGWTMQRSPIDVKMLIFCDFFFLCSLYFVWTPTHASECTKKKRGTWKLRTWRTRRVVMRIPLWKLCVLSIESVIGADFCCNKPAFHWYQHFSVVVHRRSGWKTDCNPRESKSSVCSVCVCANMQIRNSSSSFFFCLSLMLSHTVYCSDGSNSDLIVFPVFLGCLACVCIMSSCGCA